MIFNEVSPPAWSGLWEKRPKFMFNMILYVIDVVIRVATDEGTCPSQNKKTQAIKMNRVQLELVSASTVRRRPSSKFTVGR